MKILRRLVVVLCWAFILLASAGLYVRHRVYQVPQWYHAFNLDADLQRKASNDVDQMLIGTHTAAQNAQDRSQAVDLSSLAFPVMMTENDMNSFAGKWDQTTHWKNRIGSYLQDPVIVLEDHQFILAATSKEWNAVLSLHFEPRLENGKLNLRLTSVMAGTLPLPRWIWSRIANKFADEMERKLPALQHDAEIDPRGRANSAASDAATSQLLLHVLRDEPSEPVLFVPEPEHGGRSLTMQITSIDISDKTLTLKIAPMSADQREALLQRIRGPQDSSVGMGK